MQHLFMELWPLKRDSEPPSRKREYRAPSFHVGPKSGVTNSKKIEKNMRTLRGIILCDLIAGKKSNLGCDRFLESPFTKMTYHLKVLWFLGQMS
jgi:hypothetical protein